MKKMLSGRPEKKLIESIKDDFKQNKELLILMIPVLLYFAIFHYGPMYGAIIAFKRYIPMKGIIRSPWVGLDNFVNFFSSNYFWRVLRNTLTISLSTIFFGFPAPIILALMLNEVKSTLFKRSVQTISYMPHFVSIMVIAGIIVSFSGTNGLINDLLSLVGIERSPLLQRKELFVPIYVISDIWQHIGWGAVIYIAALAGIDPNLYEASAIDGAGRWTQMWHITLPGLKPTIIILLILRLGRVMSVGFEKVFLLYNPMTYETADIIATFVYRRGMIEGSYAYSTAVGLFNSAINFLIIIMANSISRRVSEQSLW